MKCIPGSQAPCAALAARRQWQSAETWDSWPLGTSFLWRKAAWIELLLSWGIMAGYLSVNRWFQLTYFVWRSWKFPGDLIFFPPKKFVLGEVSWARAQVLRLGGYAGGTRNQAFIVCLSGGARAGGLLSVYIWRGFHAGSLMWIVVYYWT